jgi:hypothetical protein
MTTTINWTPTLFEAATADGSVLFSSAKRYIKTASSGGYVMASGLTTVVEQAASGLSAAPVFHFNIPGVLNTGYWIIGGVSYDPGTPSPTTQQVTT